MIDDELAAFLESGCSTIVGIVLPSGEPFATRGWGTAVLPGAPCRVRVAVGAAVMAAAGHQPGDGARFAIAVTGADVRTLRSVQLKGTAYDLEPCSAADLDRAERFCGEFFGAVEEVDQIPATLMQRLVPADLLALTVDVAEMYDQTPGPAAGAPLAPAAR